MNEVKTSSTRSGKLRAETKLTEQTGQIDPNQILEALPQPQPGEEFLLIQVDEEAIRYCILAYSAIWKFHITEAGTIHEWADQVANCVSSYREADAATLLFQLGNLHQDASVVAKIDDLRSPFIASLKHAGLNKVPFRAILPFVSGMAIEGLLTGTEQVTGALTGAFPQSKVLSCLPAAKPDEWLKPLREILESESPSVTQSYEIVAVKVVGDQLDYEFVPLFSVGDDPRKPSKPAQLYKYPENESLRVIVSINGSRALDSKVSVAQAVEVIPGDNQVVAEAHFTPGTDDIELAVSGAKQVRRLELRSFKLSGNLPDVQYTREGIDLAFLLDATLSEDDFAKAKEIVEHIVQDLREERVPLRLALVAFGDYPERRYSIPEQPSFVVKSYDFTDSIERFSRNLAALERTPGWDIWDALEVGLKGAVDLAWYRPRRFLVAIGNSPPHPTKEEKAKQGTIHKRFADISWREQLSQLDKHEVRRYACLTPNAGAVRSSDQSEIERTWQALGRERYFREVWQKVVEPLVQAICQDNPSVRTLSAQLSLPLVHPWQTSGNSVTT